MRPREEAEAADGAGCGAVGGEALRGMRGCAYAMRGIALRGALGKRTCAHGWDRGRSK